MNILMMTNAYLPLVGGLERSIESFTKEYRKRGHRVVIVAPEYENSPKDDQQKYNVMQPYDFGLIRYMCMELFSRGFLTKIMIVHKKKNQKD